MALTAEQKATLKAAIIADQELNGFPNNTDGAFAIAALLNQTASPSFTVWRTYVATDEIMNNGFVWTVVDGLAVGKARIWDWMTKLGGINPSKANIRQGLVDCFGSGTAMANAITPHLKRLATRGEKLFATGTGSDASPAVLGFEGNLSYQDVDDARTS